MKMNILKHFGLAALLALGANAWAEPVTTTEGFKAAIANAKSGDVIMLAAGEFDASAGDAFGSLANKKVTIQGAGQDPETGTKLLWGTGRKNASGAELTFENLYIDIASTQSGAYQFEQNFNSIGVETYRNVTFKGAMCTQCAAVFDTCTFVGPQDGAIDEYLYWQYGGTATMTDCQFLASGPKGPIKLYAQAGNTWKLTMSGCSFADEGTKGGVIYATSNDYNNDDSKSPVVCEIYFGDGNTVANAGNLLKVKVMDTSWRSVIAVNPQKDESGKYVAGSFYVVKDDTKAKAALTDVIAADVEIPAVVNGQVVIEESEPAVAQNFYQDADNAKLWHVANAEGLKEFRDSVNVDKKYYSGCTVQLDADIDLQGSAENQWQPITGGWNAAFAGVFDGQNHVIKNLYIYSTTSDCLGLFGNISYATVKNVVIENVNLGGNSATGAVVADGIGSVENAHVCGAIHIGVSTEPTWVPGYTASYCGGIVGHGYISVRDCSVKGVSPEESVIAGGRQIGGIIGFESEGGQVVENCTVENVSVLGTYCVGGIQGWVHYGNVLRNCSIKNVVVGYPEGKTGSSYSLGYISGCMNGTGNFIFANNTVENSSCLNPATGQLEGKYAIYGMRVSYRIDGTTYVFTGSSHPETGAKHTLAYAIAEAQKVCGESEVYILTNTGSTEPLIIPEGMTVVLDLNGCTVATGNYKDKTITNYGTLTVRNGKIDGVAGNPATLEDTVTIINQIPFAKIGDVEYPSISKAISAAMDDDVITIVNDYDCDTSYCSITGSKRYTIDLNGHEIRGKGSYVFNVSGSAASDVTICDNSEAKSGKVVCASQDSSAAVIRTANKSAKLTILGGEFVCEQGKALYDVSGCNITVRDGTFRGAVALDGYDKGPITLAGGVFEGSECAVKVRYKTTEVLISGGTYRGGLTLTAGKLSIEGGTFDVDPTTYVVEGKTAIDNKDGTWTVCAAEPETKVVVPDESEIKPVDEEGKEISGDDAEKAKEAAKAAVDEIAGNTGAAMTEGTGVEAAVFASGEEVKAEVAQDLQGAAAKVTTDDTGVELSQAEQQEVQTKVAKIAESKDVSSYVKIDVKSPVVKVEDAVATVKTLVFDVQPMAVSKITTTVDSTNPKTVTVEAPVDYNDSAKPITFRLPLTDAFTVSAIVTHEGDPDRLCMVQGTAGARYVEVSATHFSLFSVAPSEIVETSASSKTILGIKRIDYTVTQTTADLAAAVPWLKASDADMPVAQLISTGLSEGDQIQVYDLKKKTYFSWHYVGTSWTSDALSTGGSSPSAETYTLKRGTAFWYKPAGATVGTSGTYTQVGLYTNEMAKISVANAHDDGSAATFAKPVHNLLANPKYEDFDVVAKLTDAAEGDTVVIVAANKRLTFKGGKWCELVKVEKENPFSHQKYTTTDYSPVASAVVPAGTAFWYLSAGGAPEIEW